MTTAAANFTGSLPMSAYQILNAVHAGRMAHEVGGFVWVKPRRCGSCTVQLPQQRIDGSANTFPRCSACAL